MPGPAMIVPARAHAGTRSARAESIVGESDALRYVMSRVEQVATTDATVLLSGETGTGKELFARAIHNRSHRRDGAFVVVNCAALPATLIESELFGRERGAFTGAHATQIGRFELANRGTIFLDEVGELPVELQPRLLRVLQEGQLERLGSPRTIDIDVRVIAATNSDLKRMVEEGRYCVDILTQIDAATAALARVQDQVLEAHLNHCVAEALEGEDRDARKEKVDEVVTLLKKYRRSA